MVLIKESVMSLKEKQYNIGFPIFKFKSFMTELLNIIFGQFWLWLPNKTIIMVEFSCIYFPQEHFFYFIST